MKKKIIFYSLVCALFVGLVQTAGAVALSLHDSNELGFMTSAPSSGDADRTGYVNFLIGMNLGTTFNDTGSGGSGQIYTRSINDFGSLATAAWSQNGIGTTIDLGTGGFDYIFAKYNGSNSGSEVWNISGMTGTLTIPSTVGKSGLSGWTLLTPGSNQVPDGGATVALLGTALVILEILRRSLSGKTLSVSRVNRD